MSRPLDLSCGLCGRTCISFIVGSCGSVPRCCPRVVIHIICTPQVVLSALPAIGKAALIIFKCRHRLIGTSCGWLGGRRRSIQGRVRWGASSRWGTISSCRRRACGICPIASRRKSWSNARGRLRRRGSGSGSGSICNRWCGRLSGFELRYGSSEVCGQMEDEFAVDYEIVVRFLQVPCEHFCGRPVSFSHWTRFDGFSIPSPPTSSSRTPPIRRLMTPRKP